MDSFGCLCAFLCYSAFSLTQPESAVTNLRGAKRVAERPSQFCVLLVAPGQKQVTVTPEWRSSLAIASVTEIT